MRSGSLYAIPLEAVRLYRAHYRLFIALAAGSWLLNYVCVNVLAPGLSSVVNVLGIAGLAVGIMASLAGVLALISATDDVRDGRQDNSVFDILVDSRRVLLPYFLFYVAWGAWQTDFLQYVFDGGGALVSASDLGALMLLASLSYAGFHALGGRSRCVSTVGGIASMVLLSFSMFAMIFLGNALAGLAGEHVWGISAIVDQVSALRAAGMDVLSGMFSPLIALFPDTVAYLEQFQPHMLRNLVLGPLLLMAVVVLMLETPAHLTARSEPQPLPEQLRALRERLHRLLVSRDRHMLRQVMHDAMERARQSDKNLLGVWRAARLLLAGGLPAITLVVWMQLSGALVFDRLALFVARPFGPQDGVGWHLFSQLGDLAAHVVVLPLQLAILVLTYRALAGERTAGDEGASVTHLPPPPTYGATYASHPAYGGAHYGDRAA